MEIKAGESTITFDESTNTIWLKGSMRLANMKEYDAVSVFLKKATKSCDSQVILDLTDLIFLNSSGITTLSLYVLHLKKEDYLQLVVRGNKRISWQTKSLGNLQKLWSNVKIEMILS